MRVYYEVKTTRKSYCQLNVKGSHSLRSEKSYFLVFHTDAFYYSAKGVLDLDNYMENQNLNLRLFS